jgi:hypothetical protein
MSKHTIRYVSAKETNVMIRQALKATFPATKFSVRSPRGGAVNIGWTDGPTEARVNEVVGMFESKGFDGMIDMQYSYEAWVLNGVVIGHRTTGTLGSRGVVAPCGLIAPHDDAELVSFGTGYVFTRRVISAPFARRLVAQIAEYFGVKNVPEVSEKEDSFGYRLVGSDRCDEGGDFWSTLIHRASQDRTRFQHKTVS